MRDGILWLRICPTVFWAAIDFSKVGIYGYLSQPHFVLSRSPVFWVKLEAWGNKDYAQARPRFRQAERTVRLGSVTHGPAQGPQAEILLPRLPSP